MRPSVYQRGACYQSTLTAPESTRCLLAAFAYLGIPTSLVDIGCGDGHLVRTATALGVQAHGFDIACEPCDYLTQHDLMQPLIFAEYWRKAEMVLCLEVAEHLPPDFAEILCDTLASATAPGGRLIFTAARRFQGGMGHLNEQDAEYWIGRLLPRFTHDLVSTTRLRGLWLDVAPTAWWYGLNVHVFRRR